MRSTLMHRMRGYARVVMLPVAAAFLALGQQVACASAADFESARGTALAISAPHDHAASTEASVHIHDDGVAHHHDSPAPEASGHDCPHCLASGTDCESHAHSDGCVVSVSDGAPAAVLGSLIKLDDLGKLAVLPAADPVAVDGLATADGHAPIATAPRYGPVPTYLRHCSFLE